MEVRKPYLHAHIYGQKDKKRKFSKTGKLNQ